MEELIKKVLSDASTGQPNLESKACQENIARLIMVAIKSKPWVLDLSTLESTIE